MAFQFIIFSYSKRENIDKIKSTNPIRKRAKKKKRWEERSGNIFPFWWRKILFNVNFLRDYGANDEI